MTIKLSIILNSEFLDFYTTQYFNDLKIWTIRRFNHIIKIFVDYQNYFESYINLKFWLKNILSLWSWSQITCIFEILFRTPYIQTLIRRQSESTVNLTRINFRSRYFFWNITRRHAISPVAKFHHVLGRDFVIQLVILIFIKCLKISGVKKITIYLVPSFVIKMYSRSVWSIDWLII